MADRVTRSRRRPGIFDAFVIAGGVVNIIVVVMLVGYWITH